MSAGFEETLGRARARDQAEYGSVAEVERRFHTRYRPSQRFYLDTVTRPIAPTSSLHNDEPQRPAWEARAL